MAFQWIGVGASSITFAPGSSAPAPADQRPKGVAEVIEVVPSEDEDTCLGFVFKRKRKADAAILTASGSDGQAPSYREHPPSASSPPRYHCARR